MEALVLFTGFLYCGAFLALRERLAAGVFFLITVGIAWLFRRYDERNRWR